jgi:hypothetical protein
MSKLNNYILLTIAEKSFELFKKTKYSMYTSFCKKIGLSFEYNMLDNGEKLLLVEIVNEVTLIYGLKNEDAVKYVKVFFKFDVDEIGEYERYIRVMINSNPFLFIGK